MKVYQTPRKNRTFFSRIASLRSIWACGSKHISGLNNYARPHSLVKKGMAKAAPATVAGSGPGGAYLGSGHAGRLLWRHRPHRQESVGLSL